MCSIEGCRSRYRLQIHHIHPRSRGGGHRPDNLITLCSSWFVNPLRPSIKVGLSNHEPSPSHCHPRDGDGDRSRDAGPSEKTALAAPQSRSATETATTYTITTRLSNPSRTETFDLPPLVRRSGDALELARAVRVTEVMNDPMVQELLAAGIPARIGYTGQDGFPWVIPVRVHWNGTEIVMGTPTNSAKNTAHAHHHPAGTGPSSSISRPASRGRWRSWPSPSSARPKSRRTRSWTPFNPVCRRSPRRSAARCHRHRRPKISAPRRREPRRSSPRTNPLGTPGGRSRGRPPSTQGWCSLR
ncbi:MAG: HNH endonuclease [Acidimicrobiia bacterium]